MPVPGSRRRGYTVALAALILPLGAIGDRIGRRNVLIAGTVAAAGAIIGMLATGALLMWFSWRSIFITSAAVAVVAALLLSPNTKDEHPSPPDVSRAVCTAVGIGTLAFAIIEGKEQGWTEPVVIAALVITVLAFTAYAWLGLRREHALLACRSSADSSWRALASAGPEPWAPPPSPAHSAAASRESPPR
ncbi:MULTISPECIES: MFS transporter [unclassified Streptomyces]|uniref:MFS transporter n=1 Tax=unclassified Streptomyces TaxID=2593676 RepID=UPI0035D70279